MEIKFHIPDFWLHWETNLNLIDMLNEHPEYFYDGIKIGSCFGCFAPALWNGGRAVSGYTSIEQIKNTIKLFNERDVPIRYTFTNPTLTEADMKDTFCNRIAKMAENGLNEAIVNVPCIEKHMRKNYPQYPLISSTVKQIEGYDALIEELKKDYKYVVLDYNWNNDFEKLESIPRELRSKCEILINPYCMPHCQRRGEHYKVLGRCQRKASKSPLKNDGVMDEALAFGCNNPSLNFYETMQYPTFITNDDIYSKYTAMGFENFKIEGRVLARENVLESYMYYMVKPEFRDRVRLQMALKRRPPIIGRPQRRFIDLDGKEIPQEDND